MNVHAAVLILAQIAPDAAPTPAPPAQRNLVPAWTEDPIVTFVAESSKAELRKVESSPEDQFLRRTRGSSIGVPTTAVCVAPCNMRLSSSDLYQVSGDGITSSRFFTLPRGEHAVVDVKKSGSTTVFGVGIALLIAGALAVPASIVMLAAGDGDYTVPGFITLGSGLGLMTAGTLTAMQGVTKVEVKGDEPVVRPSTTGSR